MDRETVERLLRVFESAREVFPLDQIAIFLFSEVAPLGNQLPINLILQGDEGTRKVLANLEAAKTGAFS